MALVVLEYAYEGVVLEDGGDYESLVGCVGNQVDEVINCLVDLLGREVRRGRVGESIKLVVLEHHLLLVASPSKQLAGAGNFGNIGVIR